MSPNFVATLSLLVPRTPRFRVTPKGRMAADRGRVSVPFLLRLSLATSFLAATGYALHLVTPLDLGYASEWAAAGAFGWLVINAALVWAAIRRVRSLRFAAERRSAVRFAVDVGGWVDGGAAEVQDVSVGGALVASREPLVDREAHLLSFDLPGGTASLWAQIRSSRRAPNGDHHYAFEFEPGQYPARGALARAVFHGRYPVSGTEHASWADLLRRDIETLSSRFRRRDDQPAVTALSHPSTAPSPTA